MMGLITFDKLCQTYNDAAATNGKRLAPVSLKNMSGLEKSSRDFFLKPNFQIFLEYFKEFDFGKYAYLLSCRDLDNKIDTISSL